jgi:uncharacterized protein
MAMAFGVSPGVYVREKDLSEVVANVSSASAAIVGYSAKGNTDSVMLITNTKQFIEEYGKPDPSTGHYFHYGALSYLARGNTLYCLRVTNGALYGGANVVKSDSSDSNFALGTGQSDAAFTVVSPYTEEVAFQILGANPGVWNNRIGITIENILDGGDPEPTNQYTFEIVVYWQDDDGNWAEVERWKVSRKVKNDGYGKSLYLQTRINGFSDYIVVYDSDLADTTLPKEQSTRLAMTGGSDGSDVTASQVAAGWDSFSNPSTLDFRIMINGGETSSTVQTKMKNIAESRADCIAVLDVSYASLASTTDITTFRDNTNINSSYCCMYAGWVIDNDQYNDLLVELPASGYVAGQMAYNDYVGNPWDAPMGFTRGVITVQDTTNKFDEYSGDLDVLYEAQVNPIVKFPGEGIVLWGQKTMQNKSSALSRINVRRSLIVLEKAMAISLRQFVGENNTELNRFRVTVMLEQYLDKLSAQGAFQTESGDSGYYVLCDATNNTPAVIDSNSLYISVYIKPSRTAEFIQLQTVITSSGASFTELISKGSLL